MSFTVDGLKGRVHVGELSYIMSAALANTNGGVKLVFLLE